MQEDEKLVDWETFKANLRQSLDLTGEDESVDMSDQPGADKSGAD